MADFSKSILANDCVKIIETGTAPCTYDGDHRCGDDNQCIRPRHICDGESFCRDGSDEANCDGMIIILYVIDIHLVYSD